MTVNLNGGLRILRGLFCTGRNGLDCFLARVGFYLFQFEYSGLQHWHYILCVPADDCCADQSLTLFQQISQHQHYIGGRVDVLNSHCSTFFAHTL